MKIYIDNLPGKVTEEILREKFEKFPLQCNVS